MNINILSRDEVLNQINSARLKSPQSFLAMYSSWYNGIVTDPALMMVPVDDHLVHRGDGIFEAIKLIHRRLYLVDEHLSRLMNSAAQIELPLSYSKADLKQLIIETLKAAKTENATIRVFVSRGPGGFTPNPYESCGSQVYIVVTTPKPYDSQKYETGVKVGISRIPMKEFFFATIKSCNYLPNVLMKKESVDQGWDFSVNVSPQGYIGESATENIALISQKNEFLVPSFNYTLKGTTLARMMLLAKPHMSLIEERNLTVKDFEQAKEVLMFGTTIGVLPVTEFNGTRIANGKPGKYVYLFRELLQQDIQATAQLQL